MVKRGSARLLILLLAILPFSFAGDLEAQSRALDPSRADLSRDSLEAALSRLEAAARSRAYSAELRSQAASQAAAVRRRLSEGDFRVGDRILIAAEGQETLTDTFVVAPGSVIIVPGLGQVSLRGVLRSELDGHLTLQLSRFIRDPVVYAASFLRMSVIGEVGRPGYHLFPANTPLAEALMSIGGPTNEANTSKVRVDRGGIKLMEGEPLQQALNMGLTLSELGLRSGDQITIPAKPGRNIREIVALSAAVAGFAFTLDRIFGGRR